MWNKDAVDFCGTLMKYIVVVHWCGRLVQCNVRVHYRRKSEQCTGAEYCCTVIMPFYCCKPLVACNGAVQIVLASRSSWRHLDT